MSFYDSFLFASRRSLVPLTFILIAFAWTGIEAQELLRWKLEKGQRFDVLLEQQSTQALVGKEATKKNTMTMRIRMEWTVKESSATEFQILQEFSGLFLKMGLGSDKEVIIDSSDPPRGSSVAATISKGLTPLIGMQVLQTIDDRGRTIKIEFDEDVVAALREHRQLWGLASPEALKKMLANNTLILPEKEVESGSKWTTTTQSKSTFGVATSTTEYQMERNGGRSDSSLKKISLSTTVNFKIDDPSLGSITVNEQDNSGTVFFDVDAGHITASEVRQYMELLIDDRKSKANQAIDSTTKLTIKRL